MASPTELELLKEATRLQIQCSDYLSETEIAQRERWGLLRRVIEDAGKQYAGMRHDVVEERLADQGAPVWMSVVLTVTLSFIPVSAMAGSFLTLLTGATQKLLRSSGRANAGMERLLGKVVLKRELDPATRGAALVKLGQLQDEIKRTEEMVARFAKAYEPELSNILQDGVQELGKIGYRRVFETRESGGREFSQSTDVPMVVVTQVLHRWIDSLVGIEGSARNMLRTYIRDLFDIATSKDPAKEAKAKEVQAAKKEAAREPSVPRRRPVEKLPKTSKDALDELSFLRDELETPSIGNRRTPTSQDLRELQLIAESIMWATSYDFSWRRGDVTKLTPFALEPAPLPKGLWKRLIERYIDPDENKSYKEVGALERLGTKHTPLIDTTDLTPRGLKAEKPFTPEVRLSHYFSNVLYPEVLKENNKVMDRFRGLGRV